MTFALLSIGTELTRGDLVNTNATWLAEKLASLGHEVTEIVTIDDDDDRIVKTVRRLSQTHDVIISTGGLGPTTDDRTAACVALAIDVPLVRDERSLALIRARFAAHNVVMQPSNEKQADFPRGAQVLDNPRGTAPGFLVQLGKCSAFFTPGVPAEMRGMFEDQILPRLPTPEASIVVRRLRTFGMPESQVNDALSGLEQAHRITIGYRASLAEIEVKVLATQELGETLSATEARAETAAEQIRQRLAHVSYGDGQTRLHEVVGEELARRGLTLAVAESCTGGLLSELITSVSGSSRYYLGGAVCYSNSAKSAVLGVSPELIAESGAVSAEVACALARGAQRTFGADIGVGVTGVAGPNGGTPEKPVGLVHWAVARGENVSSFNRVFWGDRLQIQRRAALSALWAVLKNL